MAKGTHPAWGARARPGLTRKEQLSSPIMMCVSSGKGAGPKLTLDMSLSSCNEGAAGLADALRNPVHTERPKQALGSAGDTCML